MRAYRETFRKHRILFVLPAVLFAVAAAFVTLSAPKSYQSLSSLWVDNAASAGSSLDNSQQATEPSSLEQTILNELLATKNFDLAVGNGSSLATIEKGDGGTTAVVQGHIASAVLNGVVSATPGPQVLQLSFAAPTPAAAQSTLSSLMTQLQKQTALYAAEYSKTQQGYYQGQVNTATAAVNRATAAATVYHRSHPTATTQTDLNYAALVAAVGSATTQLSTATASLSQAQAQAQGDGAGTTVRVLDSPSSPTGPVSGKKKAAMEILGAMIAGLFLSLLAIVVLTPGGEDRAGAEMYSPNLPVMPVREMRSAPVNRQLPTARSGPGQSNTVRRGPQAPVRRVASESGKALNPAPAVRPRPRPNADEQTEKETA